MRPWTFQRVFAELHWLEAASKRVAEDPTATVRELALEDYLAVTHGMCSFSPSGLFRPFFCPSSPSLFFLPVLNV